MSGSDNLNDVLSGNVSELKEDGIIDLHNVKQLQLIHYAGVDCYESPRNLHHHKPWPSSILICSILLNIIFTLATYIIRLKRRGMTTLLFI